MRLVLILKRHTQSSSDVWIGHFGEFVFVFCMKLVCIVVSVLGRKTKSKLFQEVQLSKEFNEHYHFLFWRRGLYLDFWNHKKSVFGTRMEDSTEWTEAKLYKIGNYVNVCVCSKRKAKLGTLKQTRIIQIGISFPTFFFLRQKSTSFQKRHAHIKYKT